MCDTSGNPSRLKALSACLIIICRARATATARRKHLVVVFNNAEMVPVLPTPC